MALARAGLRVTELVERRRKGVFDALFSLKRVVSAGDDLDFQATALVNVVVEAVNSMEGIDLARMAKAILGTDLRHRDLPYDRRRALAVEIWAGERELRDPGWPPDNKIGSVRDDSFTKRVWGKIRAELAYSILVVDDSGRHGVSVGANKASLRDQMKTGGLDRVAVKAETWLTGKEQAPYQSEWTYTDRARWQGIESYRLFTHADNLIRVEPMSDTIESVTLLGVDVYGFKVWRVLFSAEPEVDEEVVWTTRRVFDRTMISSNESSWIALTVSHSAPVGPIRRASFVVHFDITNPPKRVVRFVTPKGSLPDRLGPTEDLVLTNGVARADFQDLQSWMTHGIYWFPDIS